MRFWWPSSLPTSTAVPSSRRSTSIRHSAMFLCRIGERMPLVTVPTCARPIWTQSPWAAVSCPSSSRPTSLRWGDAPCADQGLAADEILVLGLQATVKADAGLERIGLVVELVVGEDQAGLDPHHVQCFQAEGRDAVRLAGLPRSRPTRRRRLADGTTPRSPARRCSRCARQRPVSRRDRRSGRSRSGTSPVPPSRAGPAGSRSLP